MWQGDPGAPHRPLVGASREGGGAPALRSALPGPVQGHVGGAAAQCRPRVPKDGPGLVIGGPQSNSPETAPRASGSREPGKGLGGHKTGRIRIQGLLPKTGSSKLGFPASHRGVQGVA